MRLGNSIILAALFWAWSGACAEEPWPSPEKTVLEPAPGISQELSATRRNYKESERRRVIESVLKARMKAPGSQGEYTLSKKRIYDERQLVTFHRKLEGELLAGGSLFLSEQTQISKNEAGDLKGTLLRDYYAGAGRKGPGVRLLMTFEPFMLVKRFSVTAYSLQENGTWLKLDASQADSLPAAIARLHKSVSGHAESRNNRLAPFLLRLWIAALDNSGTMDATQLVYPLLGANGASFLGELDADRLRQRLQALAEGLARSPELANWRALSKTVSSERRALAKALRGASSSPSAAFALSARLDAYLRSVEPILAAPDRPAPSLLRSFQESLIWTAEAFERYKSEPSYALGGRLEESWRQRQSAHQAEVFVRALFLCQISEELRELERLRPELANIQGLDPKVERAFQQLLDGLAENSRAWRTKLAARGDSGPRPASGALWAWPLSLLALGRTAEATQWADSTEMLYSFSDNPFSVPSEFGFALSLGVVPATIQDALQRGFNSRAPNQVIPVFARRSGGNQTATRTLTQPAGGPGRQFHYSPAPPPPAETYDATE